MPRTRLVIDTSLQEEDQNREPIELVLPGIGEYELPGVMNAMATIRVARWSEQGKTEISAQEAIALLGDLIPDDVIRKMHHAGFDLLEPANAPAIEQIVLQVIDEYQTRAIAAGTAAKGKAESRRLATPPPYSPAGASSEPTSDGSTPTSFPVT
jgi:hypothetical protein